MGRAFARFRLNPRGRPAHIHGQSLRHREGKGKGNVPQARGGKGQGKEPQSRKGKGQGAEGQEEQDRRGHCVINYRLNGEGSHKPTRGSHKPTHGSIKPTRPGGQSKNFHHLDVGQYRRRFEYPAKKQRLAAQALQYRDLQAALKAQQTELEQANNRAAVAEEALAFANAQRAFNEERFAQESKFDALWVAALQKLIVSANRRIQKYGLQPEAVLHIYDREKMIEMSK